MVDGDTIDVTFPDGSTDTVRLLGVDTPETYSGNKANEYGSITDTACLDRWGDLATGFAVEALDGQAVELVMDDAAGDRGFFDRLLAYIVVDGQDFNAQLVKQGYARVYTEGTSGREADYLRLEGVAQAEGAGLWDCGTAAQPIPPTSTSVAPSQSASPACHPSYEGACLDPNAVDYDCRGGSGNGPLYTGRVRVVGPDVFRLDGDGDGIGCE